MFTEKWSGLHLNSSMCDLVPLRGKMNLDHLDESFHQKASCRQEQDVNELYDNSK